MTLFADLVARSETARLIADSGIRELLRTPLVLFQLARSTLRAEGWRPHSEADMMEATLSIIIESSGLSTIGWSKDDEAVLHIIQDDLRNTCASSAHNTPLDTWTQAYQERRTTACLDALMLLAIVFYSDLDVRLDRSTIVSRAGKLRHQWNRHLLDARRPTHTLELLAGFALIESHTSFKALMRTVFRSIGDHEWGFAHRAWQDYLVSRYLARAGLTEHVEEFGRLAFTPEMNRLAAQMMSHWRIPPKLIMDAEKRSEETDSALYIGNLFSLFAWNASADVDADAAGPDCP
jgi:hypothetical protein